MVPRVYGRFRHAIPVISSSESGFGYSDRTAGDGCGSFPHAFGARGGSDYSG
jgi:hypothetical protein